MRHSTQGGSKEQAALTDGLAVVSILIVVYAALARRLGRWWVTMPMVFVVGGYLLGPDVLGLLELSLEAESVKLLTELTLVLLLFADAAALNLRRLRADVGLPGRLLGLGLPLTLALGGLLAYFFYPDEGLAWALMLGAVLAPTDAALGMAIFSNPKVPVRIRRALNVESGLNDGIVAPFVTLFVAYAASTGVEHHGSWLAESLEELALGVLVALGVGIIGGRLMLLAERRDWLGAHMGLLAVVGLALTAYSTALALGGNGFVAAFLGGLIFGAATHNRYAESTEFSETAGTLLSLFVWTVFGSMLVTIVIGGSPDLRAIALAVVLLSAARMLPVALVLTGAGLRRDTLALMGWFGPRGLASVVFTLLAINEFEHAGRAVDTLIEVTTWTILLSVIAHGISARPLAALYARRLESARATHPNLAELEHAPEPHVRRKLVA
jgi:NhaP-type Na+/H+ or K+/H+ antiporter